MGARPAADRLVIVGLVRRPIGLRGEVSVEPTGDRRDRFSPGTTLWVDDIADPLKIRASRPYKDAVAVVFEGIDSVEAAGALRGAALKIAADDLPLLPEGTYYHYQLIGCEVLDADGESLGRVGSILTTGSNDVLCVGEDEILIPAIRDFVAAVDLPEGKIRLGVPRSRLGMDEEPI